MESTIDNQQKYENYKEQFQRLNKAMANGFNLEAIFIVYAIMEDRTESILRHGDLWAAYLKSRKGRDITINSKIRYIQKRTDSGNKMLAKYFSDDLLDQVLAWKEERNRLIHALLKQQFEHNEINEFAAQGTKLVKALRSRTSSYNRAIDRQKGKTEL